MKPASLFALALLAVVTGLGCSNGSKPQDPVSALPTLIPSIPSAARPSTQATGIWSQAQVETWLREKLKLTELTLTSTGSGNYTGQGKDATGKVLQLKVMQVPGGIACEHSSGPGNAGRISFGNPISPVGQPIVAQPVSAASPAVQIPDTPASGQIHGSPFSIEKAVLENGVLTLRQGQATSPDLALDVMMFVQQGEPLAGKRISVTRDQTGKMPWLRLQWRENGQGRTADFPGKYALTLEFGQLQGQELQGKIHALLPDEQKSSISGTFVLHGVR